MSLITASAPGKAVLCGEYAVLEGAPAIVMALSLRARVTIEAGSPVDVSSRGLAGRTDTRLLDCVCEVLDIDRPQAAITLDTRAFSDPASGRKLGVGSSAALAVALVRALATYTDRGRIYEAALMAHRRFQDGRGSGVDVAASTAGGLVEYRVGESPRSLPWPAGLYFAMLWSGAEASTSSRLAWFDRSGAHRGMRPLYDASVAVAECWRHGDAGRLIRGLRDYVGALLEFDVDHGLGIFDAGHDELARYPSPDDTVYKPCGAGGGDVGIVLGTDPLGVARFADYAGSRGFRRLDAVLDPCGACVTPPPA